MLISLLVAMDEERGIGIAGRLPWHLSTDLKRFKTLTMGHHIIMGRKTYESIGRPLPGRKSIVITRQLGYQAEGCTVVNSLDQALDLAKTNGETEAIIIGGGDIFAQALPRADRIYLTTVHTVSSCDTFFPELNPYEWQLREEIHIPSDDNNEFATTYKFLSRIDHQ